MSEFHLDLLTVLRFIDGELSPEESRTVVRHLLRRCPRCQSLAHTLWVLAEGLDSSPEEGSPQAPPQVRTEGGGEAVRAQGHETLASQEEAEPGASPSVTHLLQELLRHTQPRRLVLIWNLRRFAVLELCHEILDQIARQRQARDPRETLALAELAVAVAEALDRREYGSALVEDHLAQARAVLADVLRQLGDLETAEAGLEWAEDHLAAGTGDPLVRAEIRRYQSLLRQDQGRLGEAEAILDEAIILYRRHPDSQLLGEALAQQGRLATVAGDRERALALLREGLTRMSPERNPEEFARTRQLLRGLRHGGNAGPGGGVRSPSGGGQDGAGDPPPPRPGATRKKSSHRASPAPASPATRRES